MAGQRQAGSSQGRGLMETGGHACRTGAVFMPGRHRCNPVPPQPLAWRFFATRSRMLSAVCRTCCAFGWGRRAPPPVGGARGSWRSSALISAASSDCGSTSACCRLDMVCLKCAPPCWCWCWCWCCCEAAPGSRGSSTGAVAGAGACGGGGSGSASVSAIQRRGLTSRAKEPEERGGRSGCSREWSKARKSAVEALTNDQDGDRNGGIENAAPRPALEECDALRRRCPPLLRLGGPPSSRARTAPALLMRPTCL